MRVCVYSTYLSLEYGRNKFAQREINNEYSNTEIFYSLGQLVHLLMHELPRNRLIQYIKAHLNI
jgi:hypothetical protein